MAEFRRPEDAFIFKSWDGVSNPFTSEPQLGRNWGDTHWEAARSCIQRFSEQFESAFLQTKTATGAQNSIIAPSSPAMTAVNAVPDVKWKERLKNLGLQISPLDTFPKNCPTLGRREASQLHRWSWQELANNFPWQRPLHRVTVFLSAKFTRIFSAVGPDLCLFLTEQNLRGSNLILAAQLVHEFGHLDHGNSKGWQKFQNCSRLEVESLAIRAELEFLKQRCSILGLAWESSWIRRDWNDSYAQLAAELCPQEAADYLTIIEQADPPAPI